MHLAQAVKAGNSGKQNYERTAVPMCVVCSVQRHKARWGEIRRPKRSQNATTRGAVCYCCVRAALALGTGCRSVEVYKEVHGAMLVWKARAELERAKLADTDICECHQCQEQDSVQG